MKRAALLFFLLTTACGSTPPPATPVPPKHEPKPTVTAPASRQPLFVELVAIEQKWVAKYVPDAPEDVKAWAETANVEPAFYWILVRVDSKTSDAAAKAKAQKLLERTKKEPFERVAREASDDPGTKEFGGMHPARHVPDFAKEVREAWKALKPGETSALVKTDMGWCFVKKAPPPDDALASQYRRAKAGELTKTLGAEMTKHLRSSPDFRAAIAESVQQVLGDLAVADPDRPKMNVVDRERIKDAKHLSAATKAGLGQFADHARPGDVLDTPASDDEMVVVARAVAAGG